MLKPLRSNVLLKPQEATSSSIAGLIIASQAGNQGIVVAVGSEAKELKAGDVVRYDEKSVVKIDGYLMCREADVLCVVE